MQFDLTAKVDSQLWTNNTDAWLYKVQETVKDKTKQWVVFTKQQLSACITYNFKGYVSEAADKKVKDANGRTIFRTNFNAESVSENSDMPF